MNENNEFDFSTTINTTEVNTTNINVNEQIQIGETIIQETNNVLNFSNPIFTNEVYTNTVYTTDVNAVNMNV